MVWNLNLLLRLTFPYQKLLALSEKITGTIPILSPSLNENFVEEFIQKWYLFQSVSSEFPGGQVEVDLCMFFSPKDLEYSLGWDAFEESMKDGTILKARAMTGVFTSKDEEIYSDGKEFSLENEIKVPFRLKVRINDLSGLTNGSLHKFADSLNVKMNAKDALDDYKTRMIDALIECPHTFIEYAKGDVEDLETIHREKLKSENIILKDVLELPEDSLYTIDSMKKTSGSLVAYAVEECINYKAVDEPRKDSFLQLSYEYALCRLGVLKKTDSETTILTHLHDCMRRSIKSISDFENWYCGTNEKFKTLWSKVKTVKRGKTWEREYESWNKLPNSKKFEKYIAPYNWEFKAYSLSTMKYWGTHLNSTSIYNAVVHGGRCVNELPEMYRDEYIADIDFKSAYASILRELNFPIGRPRTIGFTNNQIHIKLKDVIKQIKSGKIQPKDGLIQIYVNGGLNFSQDLILSKVIKGKAIQDALNNTSKDFEADLAHIDGDFNLLTNEIKGGIITLDIWNLIEKIANNKEIKSLLNLEVSTVAWFDEKDFCNTPREWIEKVLADNGQFTTKGDTRTHAFFNFPLEKVFGKTVDTRNALKDEWKLETDINKKNELNARQTALKLFNNTGYGVLASIYFRIGNTLLANIITSTIRTHAWLKSKALNIHQIITDGGFYSLGNVYTLDPTKHQGKKPGLDALSNLSTLVKHRCISSTSLGGMDWKSIFYNHPNYIDGDSPLNGKNLDRLAWEHIKDFWSHYGIDESNFLNFLLEHKQDNTAYAVAWWNKADYALKVVDTSQGKELIYKIRGARMGDDVPQTTEADIYDLKELATNKSQPKYQILFNILTNNDEMPTEFEYEHKTLLSPSRWTYAHTFKEGTYENIKAIRPGDELVEHRIFQQNNSHTRCADYATFQKRKKRHSKKVKMFETKSKSISKVHELLVADNLK